MRNRKLQAVIVSLILVSLILTPLAFMLPRCGGSVEPVAPPYTPPAAVPLPSQPAPSINSDGWEEPPPILVEAKRDEHGEHLRAKDFGLAEQDSFRTIGDACANTVRERVTNKGWVRPILDWCLHRAHHSSRNGKVVSRVDGSQIHDRDRPTAHVFYYLALSRGLGMLEQCPIQQILGDRYVEGLHPKPCRDLARKWPFKDVALPDTTRARWMAHPHWMEEYGARGPIDHNILAAASVLPGCWDPALLDRNDVSALVLVLRSLKICEEHGCRTKRDIQEWW